MKKVYQNVAPDAIPVYADSAKSQQIGKLFGKSSCICIDEQDGLTIILYKVSIAGGGVSKVGFADAAGMQG